ncbi:MAG: Rieske 2Fe-2S domain-containing protein [Candidatus Thiodiazotropha lotti]|uniref:(2Fe-2S)-binding protein n=1 Tax=Candidatus Thiodiazotropha endoloripes TaxID=1818881 RepID=A0A1E2UMJ2_9GAMM|nr:Rieske 2Fe-2S domain-containing protein [Candidatus Thiodiazotropha endoloripes]MCG7897040.1 Rieske 2Fe-2S domain-containing protein [Candidatus Thiodiazotropha weberae]MCG7991700.1 Rieske 2Fe-2S domain-containing protein [Candidatus Thiodiazotropha lotti]MCG7904486.1 Rieske 2Fe-2S domain-containing protein [Candidatus Thiodiazotropha weberae]MCG7999724.1 Rieske 2Fe-2S domain-containing protein [Candidatus Thiodiazotropha lotti]MCW4183356.1 Rieske 2Fe-2S domain-containing protein [Candidatu
MSSIHRLCRFEQLEDPGSRGFSVELEGDTQEILVVRKGERVYGYLNRCPHTGINLEWQPDQFLDLSQSYIQCVTHGALFRVEDGLCLRGPCAGDALSPIQVELRDGEIVAILDTLSGA